MDTPAPESPELPASTPVTLSRTARRERAATDALRTLIRDTCLDRFGAAASGAAELTLQLSLRVRPAAGWAVDTSPALCEQIVAQLDDQRALPGAYRPGHVFCFRCEGTACTHARPPSALSVFKGYSATGLPEWQDLHQAFVEARSEKVGQLFGDRPQVATLVQLGHGLRERQLSSFGRASKTYALLGQVVAGHFALPRAAMGSNSASRLALTFQVVETRDTQGRISVRLNTLAGLGPEWDLDELFASEWDPWVHRARELALHAIEGIERRVQSAHAAGRYDEIQTALRRVPSVLKRLAEFLERGHRQESRRTRHVEVRRREHRPVHKAWEDVQAALPAAFYHDEKTHTVVVCGPQGRAHVFNREGRHVTSFVLPPDAVEFRLRTARWRRASPEEASAFRQKIQRPASET